MPFSISRFPGLEPLLDQRPPSFLPRVPRSLLPSPVPPASPRKKAANTLGKNVHLSPPASAPTQGAHRGDFARDCHWHRITVHTLPLPSRKWDLAPCGLARWSSAWSQAVPPGGTLGPEAAGAHGASGPRPRTPASASFFFSPKAPQWVGKCPPFSHGKYSQ